LSLKSSRFAKELQPRERRPGGAEEHVRPQTAAEHLKPRCLGLRDLRRRLRAWRDAASSGRWLGHRRAAERRACRRGVELYLHLLNLADKIW